MSFIQQFTRICRGSTHPQRIPKTWCSPSIPLQRCFATGTISNDNTNNNSNILNKTAFEQVLGNTPLLYLKSASEAAGCKVYGKAEFLNPGGSVKDRAAYWMINEAEKQGILKRGEPGLIVEGTAGNTGIGLGLVGPMFGYETIIVIPKSQTQEKKDALRYAGSKLVEVNAVPFANNNHYVKVAERLARNISKRTNTRILYANQWDNLANQKAHIQGTGPEIWRQTGGSIDAFSCAVGTGGTITGMYSKLQCQAVLCVILYIFGFFFDLWCVQWFVL